jgi:ketosteroid isomerase-like protein
MAIKQTSLILIVFIALLGPLHARQSSSKAADTAAETKRAIMEREEEQNEALRTNDAERLGAMCTDELAWTNASGVLLPKETMLADIRSGKQKNFNIKHEDVRLYLYGDTVVVTGISTSAYQYNGHQATGVRRFTNVWIKRDQKWLLVVHHVTPVQQAKN